MITDSFTGSHSQKNQYVRAELGAQRNAHAASKWRVTKDGERGSRYGHDLHAKSCDKLMMAMAMREDGKVCVKFSTPEDNKEGDRDQI